MERSKLKLTVIFLLVVLNLFLLGSVVLQHHQTQAYEATTRQQILLYLENHNVSVAEEVVPWETALSTQAEDLTGQLLPQQALPEEGLPADCEIQPARAAATLLMYVVQGLPALGGETGTIQSIEEGYRYSGEGDRAVLTPMWALTTDQGTFLLDCASGALTPME